MLEIAEIRTKFPEFTVDKYPDHLVEVAIEVAEKVWKFKGTAQQFLTAHFLTVFETSTGSADQGNRLIKKTKIGEREIEYADHKVSTEMPQSDSFYSTSSYGRTYLILRNATPSYVLSARVF